jgi:hypothetical protein
MGELHLWLYSGRRRRSAEGTRPWEWDLPVERRSLELFSQTVMGKELARQATLAGLGDAWEERETSRTARECCGGGLKSGKVAWVDVDGALTIVRWC